MSPALNPPEPKGKRGAGSQRVFVALWPAPSVRTRLSELAEALAHDAPRARRIEASNIHLTLAFIGSLRNERVAELASVLSRFRSSRFDWILDRIGHFDGARVVWAGGPENAALLALAATVRDLLDASGIAYDRKPFAPHVTLLRAVGSWSVRNPYIEPPIVWPCLGPTLLRSKAGPQGANYMPAASE